MAIRLRLGFSPAASRVRIRPWQAAAFAVAGRSPSGRIAIPLASAEITSSVEAVHGTRTRAAQNAAISLAAPTTACSTCRLPITGPHRRMIAACAASNEPRTASTAASLARERDGRQAGSDKAASAGQRLGAPGQRHAHRVT